MLQKRALERIAQGEKLPYNFSELQLANLVSRGAEFDERLANSVGVGADFSHALVSLLSAQASLDRTQKATLEALAITMVKDEFGLGDELTFEATLTGSIPPLAAARTKPADSKELEPEVNKRRVINSTIQGAAGSFQYTFLLAQPELDAIRKDFARLSHELMVTADEGLWNLDERNARLEHLPPLGVFELDFSGDTICIKASAAVFPILVHELTKGVIEVLALHGLPSESEARRELLRASDSPHFEAWDLRVGKGLWRIINAELPKRKGDRNLALAELFKLPAEIFNQTISSLIDGDPEPLREIFLKKFTS